MEPLTKALFHFSRIPFISRLISIDLWGVKPSNMWDWKGLMEKIQACGVRNLLTLPVCLLPLELS